MTNTADIVVIGAGIQGIATSFNIALLGTKRVVVVETASHAGTGSSSRSAAMLMKQRETEDKIRLSIFSYNYYQHFAEHVGVELSIRPIGFLSVVPPSHSEVALARARLRQQMGVTTELLSPSEIMAFAPGVTVYDDEFGVLGPDDAVIEPAEILKNFQKRAVELGVDFRFECRATGLLVERDQIQGVRTTCGDIWSPTVVNASGASAQEVASWAGEPLPIKNTRRSIFLGQSAPEVFLQGPMVEDAELEWYYRAEGTGVLMGMGKEPTGSVTDGPNMDFLPTLRAAARHRAPGLADVPVSSGWSGIRPITPDLNPIIGPSSQVKGLIHNCGWGGEGIMHTPAGGRLAAEWAVLGGSRTLPAEGFLPARFRNPP